jgi:hypothetical protein
LRQFRSAKKIPKTVLKTRLKTKETTYTLVFLKYLVVSFQRPLNKGILSVFGRFFEDYLIRNLTCWEKSKNRFRLSASKLIVDFFKRQNCVG